MKFGTVLSGIANCPRCGVTSPLLSKLNTQVIEGIGDELNRTKQVIGLYHCSKCSGVIMASSRKFTPAEANYATVIDELLPSSSAISGVLPADALKYLKQARDTVHAPDASLVMSASAVDAMLKDKGLKDGSLYSRIDRAVEDGLMTESMGDWAHSVRLEANAVRHADEDVANNSPSDAKRSIEFASALGDFLYVLPDRVNKGIVKAKGQDFT